MLEGPEGHRSHPVQQIQEVQGAAGIDPQHDGVEEESDQALELEPLTAGDSRADHQVLLPGKPLQQGEEPGEHDQEAGRRARPAEGLDLGLQLAGQQALEMRAAERCHRRPGAVDGQLQHRQVRTQPLAPVAQQPLMLLAGERPALPDGIVGVLQGEVGKPRRAAVEIRPVEVGELPPQDGERAAVRGDVVHGERQHVLHGALAQQQGADDRTVPQVEGPAGQEDGQARRLAPARRLRQPREVGHRQRPRRGGMDDLLRLASCRRIDGAQDLVPPLDRRERRRERPDGQRSGQAHRRGDVVHRIVRLEMVEEPEAALRERKRQGLVARDRHQVRPGARALARAPTVDESRDGAGRAGGEEVVDRELDAERGLDARQQLRGEQRVAAHLEEAVA